MPHSPVFSESREQGRTTSNFFNKSAIDFIVRFLLYRRKEVGLALFYQIINVSPYNIQYIVNWKMRTGEWHSKINFLTMAECL
jgi:hypothetical protein